MNDTIELARPLSDSLDCGETDYSGSRHNFHSNGHATAELNLDVGCGTPDGKSPIPGFTGIDRKAGGEAYPLRLNDGTLVADGSVSCLRASHVLEHFGHGEVAKVFAEWVRVLKPGGTLKIAVPSLEWIARAYLSGTKANIQGYLYGGQSDANDLHKCGFDRELLFDLFRSNGLVDLFEWKSELNDCASSPRKLQRRGYQAQAAAENECGLCHEHTATLLHG